MINILILIAASLLIVLSGLHFYWATGGQWGFLASIPEKFHNNFIDSPYKSHYTLATYLVAISLLSMAGIIGMNASYFQLNPRWLIVSTRCIGCLFLLRSLGDFNICGIFKKIRHTNFAKNDNQLFIPLCLFLGSTALIISSS